MLLTQSGPVDILETMMERGSISPSSKRVEEGLLLLRLAASSFVRYIGGAFRTSDLDDTIIL